MPQNATPMNAGCEPSPGAEGSAPEVYVAVEGLGKRFGREWVFRGVEFRLRQKEILAVTGPNGSGKTTLLRILAGLDQPSEGHIALAVSRPTIEIGFAGPDLNLYSELTPQEHLQLAQDLRGLEGSVQELLSWAGIPDKPVSVLSTGMKARLRLLLALQPAPKILLLDEPFLSLDAQGIKLMEEVISRQKNAGVLIYSTNNPSEAHYAHYEIHLSPPNP